MRTGHLVLLSTLATLSGCTWRNAHRAGLVGPVPEQVVQNQLQLSLTDFSTLGSMKVGRACQDLFLGLLPYGDEHASLATALQAGQISQLKLVESETVAGFPVTQRCVVAYGI
jgi:hypothetical protein